MAKWFGKIGYAETVEERPGVWMEKITEHEYFGDVLRNSRRLQSSNKVNCYCSFAILVFYHIYTFVNCSISDHFQFLLYFDLYNLLNDII